ncbi:hypothetical protein B0T16DRAFT_497806 [Cercophora newfieldiana]|uniref:Uncharacterized protein n=1 Tax=Cercophora newfieldiana TaxID=92897 RepID=A0AA40CJV9_9PEZI|nr:hypothetical protein B0T16DRAFT_497806 [Cercophora newfieldiana]
MKAPSTSILALALGAPLVLAVSPSLKLLSLGLTAQAAFAAPAPVIDDAAAGLAPRQNTAIYCEARTQYCVDQHGAHCVFGEVRSNSTWCDQHCYCTSVYTCGNTGCKRNAEPVNLFEGEEEKK